jgi:hypothetical protein
MATENPNIAQQTGVVVGEGSSFCMCIHFPAKLRVNT